jgi:FlaA1/EpsC-like NDP-sugar epimerase
MRPHRELIIVGFDALSWSCALVVFALFRYDMLGGDPKASSLLVTCALAIALHSGIGWIGRLHQGRATVGTFEEVVLLGGVTMSAGVILSVVNAIPSVHWLPRTVPVAATFLALALQVLGRAIWRRSLERGWERVDRSSGQRTLIVGVGDAGRQLLHSMLRDERGRYIPVGFLDDDPSKRNRRLRGIPVLGGTSQLAASVDATQATLLVLAIPSAGADMVRELSREASAVGVDVKVLPGISELFDKRVGISDLRDLDVRDLLGRHHIDTDVTSIAGYLTGRRVLVTGAGGSIGSELCRQISKFGPGQLIMLDRDESALHAVQLSIQGRALLDSPDTVLGDIRDARFLQELFKERQPDVVFHAAALKHLPMLEQYPGEAIKTNVWGTLSVLEAAKASGVDRFVNISTDKAANPCSVLGYSKRLAEGLTASIAVDADGTYLSVRFGNVLGSRGSVLTSFAAQIAAGGPVTVTDPDVTRYFMTVEEAVQLVIQAGAIGRAGEALVLDMGQPVRICDVARQLIDMAGSEADIVFTGLRVGEKLHEDLLSHGEPDERPCHPQVSHVRVPALNRLDARVLDPWREPAVITESLADMCRHMGAHPVTTEALA